MNHLVLYQIGGYKKKCGEIIKMTKLRGNFVYYIVGGF